MRAFGTAALLVLAGCHLFPSAPDKLHVNHYLGDPRDVDSVRRVMVLPFEEAPGVQAEAHMIRQAFSNEMLKLQRLEIVPLPSRAREHQEIYRDLTRGSLEPASLVTLSRRYNIDGVLMGTITSFRPYEPANLGLRVQLMSLHSGQTVWAAEGIYDANDASVQEDLQHYAASFAAAEDTLHDWEIHKLSPRKYASFVSHRLSGTFR